LMFRPPPRPPPFPYTTLFRSRKRLHLAVGAALERLYPTQLEALAPLLAQHFAEAGDARALHYYILAGDVAARQYANVEAVELYRSEEHTSELQSRFDLVCRLL